MRPDRHWSRAAHVGQRAGQVPAPQLVFGAVGARRRGVAVTGSCYGTDVVAVCRESVVVPAESTALPTTTLTVLILPPRKRSPRSFARLARCPGAPTSWAAPPQRWMTPRPNSSRLGPAPASSSSCTTSRCSNASCSDAKRRQFVEILSRPIRIRAWPAIAAAAATRRAGR